MHIEYELKVLDIDVEEVREKLSSLGTSCFLTLLLIV